MQQSDFDVLHCTMRTFLMLINVAPLHHYILHYCTITYCTITQLQHALHGPVGSRIPFACPHTLASKVPQDTDPRFSIFCVMMINWCDGYQNGCKHFACDNFCGCLVWFVSNCTSLHEKTVEHIIQMQRLHQII